MFPREIAAGHRWGVAKYAQLIAVKTMSDKGQARINISRPIIYAHICATDPDRYRTCENDYLCLTPL